jgi:polyisoprenoid-binding protein YceI
MKKLLIPAALLASAAFGQSTYQIDPSHSAAQFSVRHLMISNVKGEFSKVSGTIVYDAKNLNGSKVDAVIDATTVNTREAKRDEHLKSPDFFDVAKFPTLAFKSKQVFKGANGKIQVKGDLTMHGTTKEVVLTLDNAPAEVKDPWGNQRMGVQATTQVNRKDFGLIWNQALDGGGVAVGDQVSITLDIEAVKPKPATATN